VAYLPPEESYGRGLYQECIAVVAPGGLELLIDALADQIALLVEAPNIA
jgi:hypothetical protein